MDDTIQSTTNWPSEINFENINPAITLQDFTYIATSICPDDLYTHTNGCSCVDGDCTIETCPCIQSNPMGQIFDPSSGRLLPLVHGIDFQDSISECGPHCSCQGLCSNSPTINTMLKFPITLRYTPNKGIGAFSAAEIIPRGSFVSTYSGELLRTEEASLRLKQYDEKNQGHALLVLREVLPSGSAALRTHIDATKKGNVARFFNHRCGGGNLDLLTARSPGFLIPRVCLFANRDIYKGEELTFAYGLPNSGEGDYRQEKKNKNKKSGRQCCFCESNSCLGFLPHQDV